jgi:hypothetical protein
MNSLVYRDPYIFLDDVDEFFGLVQATLGDVHDIMHIYLIARMSMDIAMIDPKAVRRHMRTIDYMESIVAKSKNESKREWILSVINHIRRMTR